MNTPLLANAPADSSTLAAGDLIEPEQVARYAQNRANDPDRWLAGMRKIWRRLHPAE